jgi:hypothetical protein
MDERIKKAFDFYADATKQLITLSTAIIALMIAFSKEVLKTVAGPGKIPLMVALIVYLLSIGCGLFTLLNLTGQLEPFKAGHPPDWTPDKWPPPSIYAPKVSISSKLQVVLFMIATGLIVLSGGLSVWKS